MFGNDLWEHICAMSVDKVMEDPQDHPLMFGSMWFPVDHWSEQLSVPDLFMVE